MLNLDLLENCRKSGDKVIARCPACVEEGHDRQGNHLVIFNKGKGAFGCVANPKDKAHQKRIYDIVGVGRDKFRPSRQPKSNGRTEKKEKWQKGLTDKLRKHLTDILSHYLSNNWRGDLELLSIAEGSELTAHAFVEGLFKPDEVLWLGETKFDSGKPRHSENFKSCQYWLKKEKLPPRIRLSLALIYCLQSELNLTLRAVIDTGGKSLHGWFDRPSSQKIENLLSLCDGLKIDKSVVNQSATMAMRFVGCPHESTNGVSRLLYLNKKYEKK